MPYCPSEYPGAMTSRDRAIGTLGFFKAAMYCCGNARSVPSLLCLTAGRGIETKRLSNGNRKNYTNSTSSALPYPISVKCRIIAIQRAGTCFTSINRVVLQRIPRGSRELSPFYKWSNSGTGIKAKMFQPGCLLLGTYTHIYATRGLIFQKGRAMKILAWGICSRTVYW